MPEEAIGFLQCSTDVGVGGRVMIVVVVFYVTNVLSMNSVGDMATPSF